MVKTFVVGELMTNCYLYVDDRTGRAMVIDPADDGEVIDDFVKNNKLELGMIVNTHCHFDHVGANAYFCGKYSVPLAVGEKDVDCLKRAHAEAKLFQVSIPASPDPDVLLRENDFVNVGDSRFKVIFTPGHTAGSICLYEENEKILFSGDTLFFESVGRWDLPGGDYSALMRSLEKLFILPDDTVVYPGHGDPTTIGYEKKYNPFLK